MAKNYYDVLGVNKNSTPDEIKKAYRTLSKKYHPDRNNGDDTKFKEINEAYSVLGDENKRRDYDNPFGGGFWNGSGGFSNGGFHFSGGFRQMASDIQVRFTIPLELAHRGCTQTVNVNGRTISVDIPMGTTNGKVLRIEGMGQSGYNVYGQKATGDLIVTVFVENTDKIWLNNNGMLEVMCGIDWIDAILGGESTTTVFGEEVKFRIPKYSQNGGFTIVGGKGFHKFKSTERGNLKINFIVRMPKKLTDEQIEQLKKIKESL